MILPLLPAPRADHGRIRVAFCVGSMDIGGTELNAVRTAERLDRSRFELSIVCLRERGILRARYTATGLPITAFPISNLYGPHTALQALRLVRFFAQHRFHIVHCHDIYTNVFCLLAAWVARTPAVIASRRWWKAAPRSGLLAVNRVMYRFADCVLANSPSVAALVEHEDGVAGRRIAVVPNFVDEGAFTPLSRSERSKLLSMVNLPEESLIIGTVANLRPVKDQVTLLRAMARLAPQWPQLRLVLVGEGESRPSLEALALELGIADQVRFPGTLPNRPNPHQLFTISVLCSRSEAFPNSVVEAMAAGRPVVATDVGGIPDAVCHGQTGLLVPPGAPDALAAAIEQLLRDPERCRAMGEAGERIARQQYHETTVMASLEALYERLVQQPPPTSVPGHLTPSLEAANERGYATAARPLAHGIRAGQEVESRGVR